MSAYAEMGWHTSCAQYTTDESHAYSEPSRLACFWRSKTAAYDTDDLSIYALAVLVWRQAGLAIGASASACTQRMCRQALVAGCALPPHLGPILKLTCWLAVSKHPGIIPMLPTHIQYVMHMGRQT